MKTPFALIGNMGCRQWWGEPKLTPCCSLPSVATRAKMARCAKSTETARKKGTMKITQDDALSLLVKYEEERTPVLAVVVTPSLSVARVVGRIHVSVEDGVPRLIVGEQDSETKPDRLKFRFADCVFEYGDFREAKRDEESAAHKYEGFLVIASAEGDTLSLFEPKG